MNDSKPLVIANLKANKTWEEMSAWLDQVGNTNEAKSFSGTIVVCPASPFLASVHLKISSQNLPFILGSQDISKFEEGAYTGEFAASQLVGICKYSIIGHSERRKYFGETDDDLIVKSKMLIEHQIIPILCVGDLNQLESYLKRGQIIIDNCQNIVFVYEPPGAISGGGAYRPEEPQEANNNARLISQKLGQRVVTIYGGSINQDNISSFFSQEYIGGGLIGQASLDSKVFIQLISRSAK